MYDYCNRNILYVLVDKFSERLLNFQLKIGEFLKLFLNFSFIGYKNI